MDRKKILIVEDEVLTAQHLEMLIEDAGYSVVGICDRGERAIKEALRLKPDWIFMDVMLKDSISGSEAALKITTLIDTKIIFLT
ncbi:MAG TPA: response regulator, partial [Nitratifractor sp.]|nr:response regulator [Nitratifractor sp.]